MITVAQFETMSGTKHAELIDGVVVEKNGGGVCGSIGARLCCELGNLVDRQDAGYVLSSTAGYACFPHRVNVVRKPNISFVKRDRFPNNRLPQGLAHLVPDLVAVVAAPADTCYDIDDRLNDYLRAGVPLVWIVNPDVRTVCTYASDGSVRRLTAEQELTADPVLTGFRVRIADLFPPELVG